MPVKKNVKKDAKETKRELRRIDPVSTAQILGLIYLVFGFLFGIAVIAADLLLGTGQTLLLGWVAAAFPFLYAFIFALLGIVCGLIGAALYNAFAKRIGGVKIEVR